MLQMIDKTIVCWELKNACPEVCLLYLRKFDCYVEVNINILTIDSRMNKSKDLLKMASILK